MPCWDPPLARKATLVLSIERLSSVVKVSGNGGSQVCGHRKRVRRQQVDAQLPDSGCLKCDVLAIDHGRRERHEVSLPPGIGVDVPMSFSKENVAA